jgi:D-alanyl-D-alanine carboxypeptidase (penicillin-binding protein 5/6)
VPARNAWIVAGFLVGVLAGPLAVARAGLGQTPGSFPPATPVPPDGSLSPYPTSLSTPPPSDSPPGLRAASVILVDLEKGQTLFAVAPHARRPIASLTKVMTALLVLERTDSGDEVIASARAAGESGSELGLRAGEVQTVEDLLEALMMQSANDAAVALAEHVGGTVEGFVGEMNARAAEMGLKDTSFSSPNGLDDRGYSTAADLARLTRAALDVPRLAEVVRTQFADVPPPAPAGEPRHIQNRNALLWLYPGARGVKTGFTSAAGYCLIAAAEQGDEGLLGIVLGEPHQAWDDAATLLNFGFLAFDRSEVMPEGAPLDPVRIGRLEIPAVAAGTVTAYVDPDDPRISVSVRPRPGLSFPIREGDPLGQALVSVRGVPVGRVPVVVGELPPLLGEGRPAWLRVVQAFVAVLADIARRTAAEVA